MVTRSNEETNRYRSELAALKQYATMHEIPKVRATKPQTLTLSPKT